MKEEEYDTENVTVQIVELSPDEIAKSNNWIGSNKPVYEVNGSSNSAKSNRNAGDGEEAEEDEEEDDEEEEDEEEVPGFTVTSTKKSKKRVVATDKDAVEDDADEEETKPKRKRKNLPESFSSKREIGQVLAKNVQNKLRQSKAFRTKAKLERVRDRKKARIEKDKRMKQQNKRDKHKKNSAKGGGAGRTADKPQKFNKKGRGKK